MIIQDTYIETIKTLSPIQFKMCFTSQERIAIKALKATDEIVADAYEILDDARLTEVDLTSQSVKDLIQYLVSIHILEPYRAEEILSGNML